MVTVGYAWDTVSTLFIADSDFQENTVELPAELLERFRLRATEYFAVQREVEGYIRNQAGRG